LIITVSRGPGDLIKYAGNAENDRQSHFQGSGMQPKCSQNPSRKIDLVMKLHNHVYNWTHSFFFTHKIKTFLRSGGNMNFDLFIKGTYQSSLEFD